MSRSRSRTIGITMGDPSGVGPEVIACALASIRPPRGIEFAVIGDEDVFRRYWPKSKAFPAFFHLPSGKDLFKPGASTGASGRASLCYLDKSIEMLKSGTLSDLVTGPVSKESVGRFVPGFKGHTTYLANAFGRKYVEMLFVADDLKMVLVTRHIPLKKVTAGITSLRVKGVVSTTYAFLKEKFGIRSPRVAVCGLNPHAGEGGQMGDEEVNEVAPAIRDLRKKGWDVCGPFPADTLFEPRNRKGYDLIVSMYHDQGLPVLKATCFDRLVNLTIGLPFIRTSPAHGTAFGIAGQGIADPGSMTAAIKLAARLA